MCNENLKGRRKKTDKGDCPYHTQLSSSEKSCRFQHVLINAEGKVSSLEHEHRSCLAAPRGRRHQVSEESCHHILYTLSLLEKTKQLSTEARGTAFKQSEVRATARSSMPREHRFGSNSWRLAWGKLLQISESWNQGVSQYLAWCFRCFHDHHEQYPCTCKSKSSRLKPQLWPISPKTTG